MMPRRLITALAGLALAFGALAPAPVSADATLPSLPGLGTAMRTAGLDAPEPDAAPTVDEDTEAAPEATPAPAPTDAPAPMGEGLVPKVEVEVPTSPATGLGDDTVDPADRFGLVVRVHYAGAPRASSRSLGSARGCPAAPTCEAYAIGKARWPTDGSGNVTIPYAYNDAGRPPGAPSVDAVRSALRASTAEWSRWNPKVAFVEQGSSSATFARRGSDGSCDDGVNVVTWAPMRSGVVGAAAICYDRRSYQIMDADLVLNSNLDWAIFGSPALNTTAFDVRSIYTHELGHWLSLFDLKMRMQSAQTMFGITAPGEIRKRTLALGDIAGLQTAYPCTGCPRTGIADD